jgi:hypothetical protein
MTRGMKGCYVYFTDKAAERHFRSRLTNRISAQALDKVAEPDMPYHTNARRKDS